MKNFKLSFRLAAMLLLLTGFANAQTNPAVKQWVISTWILQSGQGTMPISEENLNAGIYFYRFIVDGKIINSNKIVIIK